MSAVLLRIVILHVETDVWCEVCALPCATTVTYIEEVDDQAPEWVYRLTYCDACSPP